jgi:hypothetical protein
MAQALEQKILCYMRDQWDMKNLKFAIQRPVRPNDPTAIELNIGGDLVRMRLRSPNTSHDLTHIEFQHISYIETTDDLIRQSEALHNALATLTQQMQYLSDSLLQSVPEKEDYTSDYHAKYDAAQDEAPEKPLSELVATIEAYTTEIHNRSLSQKAL